MVLSEAEDSPDHNNNHGSEDDSSDSSDASDAGDDDSVNITQSEHANEVRTQLIILRST